MTADVRIGTQGWNYDAWVGPFYPLRTRPADYLTVYARAFDTVEVDSTFYAIPPAKTVRGWHDRTPPGFVFALKLPQEILAETVEERKAALAKLLPTLPRDLRFSVEFRQRGWIQDGVLALLAEHGVGLTLSDARWIPRKQMLALVSRPTADFLYVRWMGANRDIVDYSRIQIDRTAELEAWAAVLWPVALEGVRVYGYVNNHFAGHSPQSARELQRALHGTPVDPATLGEQMSLF